MIINLAWKQDGNEGCSICDEDKEKTVLFVHILYFVLLAYEVTF
ncbi:hypothetical protein HanXRQr2_Chr16g0727691 [Helianthus annuus]|uniref:Uncharacterized protein n=1 Tax=Helianthus annuus TaxID=4232 RepID=A0A9K3DMG3_HELAN|nr:hypothetical protein HanXRQr2_Chr16g0727691 [Helianthus annuus]